MSRILFLESVAGIAGDMFAASFVDAGLVLPDELHAIPEQLGLRGVRVEVTKTIKATMQATHIDVVVEKSAKQDLGFGHMHASADAHSHLNIRPHGHQHGHGDHSHTHFAELDRFIEKSRLKTPVKAFARKVFRLIAEAEAQAHGMSVEEVAFHEVGAVDSIVDVAMAAYCIAKVAPTQILATAVKLGRGTIQIAHGTHPVPPPATARLVLGMEVADVPAAVTRPNVELSTPTGVAILKALEPKFVSGIPSGKVLAQGMGGGTIDLATYPNVFRVTLLEASSSDHAADRVVDLPYETDTVMEISCNLDDETAERTAWIVEQLMDQGALDAWVTPVTGKKGRAGVCLSVLVHGGDLGRVADWLLRQSSTFGVRYREWERLKLSRQFETRTTPEGDVRFKVGMTTSGTVLKEKPEYDDLQKIWKKNPNFKP